MIFLRKGSFLSALIFLFFFLSCKEDGEVVPDFNSSNLSFGDTIIEVTSSTVAGDTVLTSGTSRHLLGKLNDETYGLTISEFFTQIRLPSSSLNIPATVSFDSIVLYLAYDNFYGFPSEQDVKVYELEEDMTEVEYYSNASIAASGELLGSAKMIINQSDTFGDSTYVLEIKLADELADRIKAENSFSSQTAWLEFFKGIKVTTDPTQIPGTSGDGEGAIVYFNLLSSKSKMRLFYQENGETKSYDFFIESNTKRFSHFENTFSPELLAVLEKEDLEYNYIFSMSGTRTKITIPLLSKIASQAPLSINKAELIIPYELPEPENYFPPDRNVILLKGEDGNWVLPNDFFTGGTNYFGGSLDEVNLRYTFNIASTLSEMINKGELDKELYLSVSGSAVTANRLKLNSGIHPKRKIYLILSYTKSG